MSFNIPSIPSIFIPSSKKDLWLNINSEKSIISWNNSIYERRKIKNKKGKHIFCTIYNQETSGQENRGWRQVFFDFSDNSEYEIDDIFSFLRTNSKENL
jgi:hypothetical protein